MAVLLKRDYDLVVLMVELLDTRPNVRFTLQVKIDGALADLGRWKSDTSDMGFVSRSRTQRETYRDVTGNLPNEMLAGVQAWVNDNTTGDVPLWVHLVKPYGVLRFVPWERALGAELRRPVLMLPDFIFPPPRESSSVLDVALCGSAPLGQEEHWVHRAMRDASHRILDAAARRTRLHIFADSVLTPALRDEYAGEKRLGVDVFVHGHEKAAPYVEADPSSRLVDQTGQLRSPWLLWMRDALRGQSIDVMHFVCHGYLTRDRGALLFAQSPMERTDRYVAGPVGQTELATFLTQLGAWSTAFTSVWDDNSEPGLRALADDVAQSRPGPLLMHTVRNDPPAAALVDAYRLLYSTESTEAPTSTSLLMYCQPYRVKRKQQPAGEQRRTRRLRGRPHAAETSQPGARDLAEGPAQAASPLDEIFQREETVLPWVASTERFAEQVQLRFRQSAREEGEGDRDAPRDPRQQATMETLDKLRAAVARMATAEAPQGETVADGESAGGVA